ncbi:MAG: Ig-like domain-containing protein [Clostridia bacterium]|nr:Ig-like domain-containing protein [Clostridia bacterium]
MMKRLTALMLALAMLLSLMPTVAEDGVDLDTLMQDIEVEEQLNGLSAKRFVESLALLPEKTALYTDEALEDLFGTLNREAIAYVVERKEGDIPEEDTLLVAVAVRGSLELLYCLAGETVALTPDEANAPGVGYQVPGTNVWLNEADITLAERPEQETTVEEPELPADELEALDDDKAAFRIVAQPTTQVVEVGGSVVMAVVATGVKSYQWQYSTDSGKTWQNNTSGGYNTSSMTFGMVAAFSGRQYRCKLTGEDNSVKYTDVASIYLPVSITAHPETQVVANGETVSLTVKAVGVKTYQWQWTKDGSTWNNNTSSGYNTNTLSFSMSDTFNGRQYRCRVTGYDGTVATSNPAAVYNAMTILTQPKSQSVSAGKTVSLSVVAVGVKTYQWQWSKDGKTWNNNTGTGYNKATFAFSMTAAFNGRQYRCQLTAQNGAVKYTDPAFLYTGVGVVAHPASQSVKVGENAIFTVKAVGVKAYQWQWTRDGQTWTNNTGTGYNKATFAFAMTAAFNGRQYRCQLTGADGTVIYTNPALLVTGIAILTHPRSQAVNAGDKVTLTVEAIGVKSYQWQYSTDGGQAWKNNTGAGYNTPTFSFTATAVQIGRKYRCRLTDDDGNAVYTDSASLTASDNPVITGHPASQTAKIGATVTLKVTATGVKSYQWQYSTDGGQTWKNNTGSGCNTDTLSFKMTEVFHGRKYRCEVTGTSGNVKYTKAATIQAAATVTVHPKSQSAKIGAAVTLTVTASAVKAYQWQFSADSGNTWKDNSSSGYNTASLSFTMAKGYHGRQFRCRLTGLDGKDVYTDVATVQAAATVTVHPKSQSARIGAVVTLTVTASAVKAYQWQFSADGGQTWKNNSSTGYNTDSLPFKMVEGYHGRQYRCRLTGLDGKDVYTNVATVQAAATVTEHPQSQSVAQGKTVTLSVTALAVKAYQWQWTADDKSWKDCSSTGYNKASFSFSMGSAQDGRKYRCRLTGLDGKYAYTNAATVTLIPDDQLSPDLTLSEAYWIIYTPPAATKTFTVTSERSWNATSDAAWLTVSVSGSKLTLRAARNNTGLERTAEVTVANSATSEVIHVVQSNIEQGLSINTALFQGTTAANPAVINEQAYTVTLGKVRSDDPYFYVRQDKLVNGAWTRIGTWAWSSGSSFLVSPTRNYCKIEAGNSYRFTIWEHSQTERDYAQDSGTKWVPPQDERCTFFYAYVRDTIHVESVNLNYGEKTMLPGETLSLTATVNPQTATDKSVTWSSSNTAVATVSNGTVTAKAAGTATITVKSVDGEKTDTCVITVQNPVAVTGVRIDMRDPYNFYPESVEQFRATVFPSNATNKKVHWTSENPNIATVTDDGIVSFVGFGDVNIIATTDDGSFTDSVEVQCSLRTPNVRIVEYGAGISGKVEWDPVYGADFYEIYWITARDANSDESPDPTLATTTTNTYYEANFGTFHEEWYLYVKAKASADEYNSQSAKGKVVFKDPRNFYTYDLFNFKSSNITNQGFTLTWNGVPYVYKYDIYYFKTNNYPDSWTYYGELAPEQLNALTLTNLTAGTEYEVSINPKDYKNEVLVERSFRVTTTGTAPNRVTSFTLNVPSTLNMNAGEKQKIDFTYSPSSSGYDPAPKWTSSNTSVATVSRWTGTVTAKSAGTATITATTTDGSNITRSFTVKVTGTGEVGEVTNIRQTEATETSISLTWDAAPNATEYVVYYTEGNIETYHECPAVTGLTCTITGLTEQKDYRVWVLPRNANMNGHTGNYVLMSTVGGSTYLDTPVPVITTDKEFAIVGWEYCPNATGCRVYYSATSTRPDTAYADVSAQAGSVTVSGLTPGSAYYFWVEVYNDANSAISKAIRMYMEAYSLNATYSSGEIEVLANGPWTATANKTWIHLSATAGSGSMYITVSLDENTSTASRSGTVTFTCGTVTKSVTIPQDGRIAVTGVSLSKTEAELSVGGTTPLSYQVLPSNAANQNVTWSSSNTSVAVYSDGYIRAKGKGTAVITVTTADGNKEATCNVTVIEDEQKVESIVLMEGNTQLTQPNSYANVSMKVGDTKTIRAVVSPSTAINKTVRWETSNSSVATVSNGVITIVGGGCTKVRAISTDGSDVYAELLITVEAEFRITDELFGTDVTSGTAVFSKFAYANETRSFSIDSNVKWTLWDATPIPYNTPSDWLRWDKSSGDVGKTTWQLTLVKVPGAGITYSTKFTFRNEEDHLTKYELTVTMTGKTTSDAQEYELYLVDDNGYWHKLATPARNNMPSYDLPSTTKVGDVFRLVIRTYGKFAYNQVLDPYEVNGIANFGYYGYDPISPRDWLEARQVVDDNLKNGVLQVKLTVKKVPESGTRYLAMYHFTMKESAVRYYYLNVFLSK